MISECPSARRCAQCYQLRHLAQFARRKDGTEGRSRLCMFCDPDAETEAQRALREYEGRRTRAVRPPPLNTTYYRSNRRPL